jgi:hypothetical protein
MLTPRPLAHSLRPLAQKTMGKEWQLYAALIEHWREIIGDDFAESVAPVKISFPIGKGHDGTLTLKAPQGLIMQLTYQSERVLDRIAGFMGARLLVKLRFEPYYPDRAAAAAPPKAPAPENPEWNEKLASIPDPDLRKTLEELGKSVAKEDK